MTSNQKSAFWLSLLFVLLVSGLCAWVLFNPKLIQEFQTWGYVGAFVINAIASATIVLPVPGAILTTAMGTALNPFGLSLISGIGSALGELTGYFAGRSGQILIPDSQQATFERLQRQTERYGAFLLLVLAAFPFPLFDLVGIIAGATGMAPWKFFLATAIGKTIKYLILILLGSAPIGYLQHWLRL